MPRAETIPEMKKNGSREGIIMPEQIESAVFTASAAVWGLATNRQRQRAVRLILSIRVRDLGIICSLLVP